jgi:transcriptional regulator with XRE-family HTH domain
MKQQGMSQTAAGQQPRLQLIEARLARHLSQRQIADELGTTHVNVSRWERGITKPNPYFRQKLCKLFGKTEAELDLQGAVTSTRREALILRLSLSNDGEAHEILLAVDEKNRLKLIS